jgi:hypothetical protein
MVNKEFTSTEVDWGQAIEDAIDADLTRLVMDAIRYQDKAEKCGCHQCKNKAHSKEEDKNQAIYHWFTDLED